MFRSYFTPHGFRRQLKDSSEKEKICLSSNKLLKILIGFFGIIFGISCLLDLRTTDFIYNSNKKNENNLPIQEITKPKYPVYIIEDSLLNDSVNYMDSTTIHVRNNIESQSEINIKDLNTYYTENNDTRVNKIVSAAVNIEPCPATPLGLVGEFNINLTKLSLSQVDNLDFGIGYGGHFTPYNCKPNHRVAVIIPYRDRAEHLGIFLNNMHKFLKRQQIEYQIFVVEQKGDGIFNRAILKNIGYIEANKLQEWDCYVFHDVDLLPLDDRILYTCPEQPRHLSVAIDKFNFKLPYERLCGGVLVMTKEHFKTVNGFSNKYWGWGAEDDDMTNRIKYHNYTLSRYPASISRYTMLQHVSDKPNPKRYEVLKQGKQEYHMDGLSDLNYTLAEIQIYNLYTLFLVELIMPE